SDDERVFGGCEHCRGASELRIVAAYRRPDLIDLRRAPIGLREHQVCWQRQDDRTLWRRERLLEGTLQRDGQLVGEAHFVSPLCELAGNLDQVGSQNWLL